MLEDLEQLRLVIGFQLVVALVFQLVVALVPYTFACSVSFRLTQGVDGDLRETRQPVRLGGVVSVGHETFARIYRSH